MASRKILWFCLLSAIGLHVGSHSICGAGNGSTPNTNRIPVARLARIREFRGYLLRDRWNQIILLNGHNCNFIDPSLMDSIKGYLGSYISVKADGLAIPSTIPPRAELITGISEVDVHSPNADFDLAIGLDKSQYLEKEMMQLDIKLKAAKEHVTVISPHSFFICFASKRKDYSGAGVAKGIGDMALFPYRDGFFGAKSNQRFERGTIARKVGISRDIFLRNGRGCRKPTLADNKLYGKQLQKYSDQVLVEPNAQMSCSINLEGILPRGEYEVYLWYSHENRQMSNVLRIDVKEAPKDAEPNMLPWGPLLDSLKVRIEPEKLVYQKGEAIGIWTQFHNNSEFPPTFLVYTHPARIFHVWDERGHEITPLVGLDCKDFEYIGIHGGPSLLKYYELSPQMWALTPGQKYYLQAWFEYKNQLDRKDIFRGPLESNRIIIRIHE